MACIGNAEGMRTGPEQSTVYFPECSATTCPYIRERLDTHCMDYCRRSLTLERDKFPALSGLAKSYHQLTEHDYLAGLWLQSLLKDLLWMVYDHSSALNVEPTSIPTYTAPS